MSEELKPCPFCGSKNVMIDDLFDNGTNTVFCGECQSKSSNFCHFDSAIEQWNTRAPQNEWISVDDELPENITTIDLLINAKRRRIDCVFMNGKFYVTPNSGDWVEIKNTVTHWMIAPPLPTPLKEI